MNHTSLNPGGELQLPPLALYIHIPWCVRKCPYCDFNSHEKKGELPVAAYVEMLKRDLEAQVGFAQGRPIQSIFFGGGTPSLFPSDAIAQILSNTANTVDMSLCQEITLETNPGTAEYSDFDVLLDAGVNRLSFGAQSFNNQKLEALGRIHQADEIFSAIARAKQAGFTNYNIDLMHGLPNQSTKQALDDLKQALSLGPRHLSWYQLTIEPNTAFYSKPPPLPSDDEQYDIYRSGRALLAEHGFKQYEVSAYAQHQQASLHNLNYWQFGDYLAIGAGAHGKVSLPSEDKILRFNHTRSPKDYLARTVYTPSSVREIKKSERALEYMMNALRLLEGVELSYFSQRTGIALADIEQTLRQLRSKQWLHSQPDRLQTTEAGHYFLNDVLGAFMEDQ